MRIRPGAILAGNAAWALPVLLLALLAAVLPQNTDFDWPLAPALLLIPVCSFAYWAATVAREAGPRWRFSTAFHAATGHLLPAGFIAFESWKPARRCGDEFSYTTDCYYYFSFANLGTALVILVLGLLVPACFAIGIGEWARDRLGIRDPEPVLTLGGRRRH